MPPSLPSRAAWRVPFPTAYPGQPETEGLLEPGVDALPVRVLIQQDGFMTGWDDGAMGFEADGFWFSGRATSFRIFANEVDSSEHDRRDVEGMTAVRLLHAGFPLRHPSRAITARVAILNLPERKDWEDEARLVQEIRRLRRDSNLEGASQYPPLTPRPGARLIHAPPSYSTEVMAGFDSFSRSHLRRLANPFVASTAAERLRQALAEERP